MDAASMVAAIVSETGDDQLGTLPYTYINQIIEELNGLGYWRCLERNPPYQINTKAPVATGTVTVTAGSTTVTGASTALTAAMVGQLFRIEGEDTYYWISSVDVGAQTMVLESGYSGVSGAGKSHSVYFVNYALDATLDPTKVRSITIQNYHRKLERMDDAERDLRWPDLLQNVKEPYWYTTWGESSIQVLPVPDAVYVLVVHGQKIPREVSAGQTVIDFPTRMHQCIFFGALALAWEHKDDDNVTRARQRFESMALQHFQVNNKQPDYAPRLERFVIGGKNRMVSRMGSTIDGSGAYT